MLLKSFWTQGCNWRVDRVGNCPPRFWKNRRRRQVAAKRRITTCLPIPALDSYLRPCKSTHAVFEPSSEDIWYCSFLRRSSLVGYERGQIDSDDLLEFPREERDAVVASDLWWAPEAAWNHECMVSVKKVGLTISDKCLLSSCRYST